jgi:hypothetical protein
MPTVDCNGITIPTVDETALECNEFIKTNCIKTSESYPFFGIAALETLTSAFDKIVVRIKAVNEKFRNTIDLTNLPVFANDTAAGTGGLTANMPYRDTAGFLRVKL